MEMVNIDKGLDEPIFVKSIISKGTPTLFSLIVTDYGNKEPHQIDVKILDIGKLMKHLGKFKNSIERFIDIPIHIRKGGERYPKACRFDKTANLI